MNQASRHEGRCGDADAISDDFGGELVAPADSHREQNYINVPFGFFLHYKSHLSLHVLCKPGERYMNFATYLRSILLAALATTLYALPTSALDTLRVGIGGNVSWTGETIRADLVSILPEYKVNRQFTAVGNVPGNLIDLSNLQVVTPRVLVKTVVDVKPELLTGQLALVEQLLLDQIEPLEGVTQIGTATQGFVSVILVDFAPEVTLNAAMERVEAAVDAIRSTQVVRQVQGETEADDPNLECREESRRFDSTADITDDWGDCETIFQDGIRADCYQTICRNLTTGDQTSRPGRLQGGGKLVAQRAVQQGLKLPAGTDPVVLPVGLSPDHVARGENVAERALGWGGRITAPAIKDVTAADLEVTLLELIAPGGAEDAFSRKGIFGALGTFIVLDLGSPIGVNRIRFYPRNTVQNAPQYPFQNDFIRQFELLLHDGQDLVLDGTGRLVPQFADFEILLRSTENEDQVVDVQVQPARPVRFVRIKSTSSFPYEIDELEVYGQGFIGSSRYISHVYDLGGVATWGNISWQTRLIDLRSGTVASLDEAVNQDCTTQRDTFSTAADIPDDWGECDTASLNLPGQGYTTVWICFQTACRDNTTGDITRFPGQTAGKQVAAKPTVGEPSQILVRTRTGSDPNPLLYYRRDVQRIGEDERSTSLINLEEQLGRDEYLSLAPDLEASPPRVWDKGEIGEDLENWSPWSAPYRRGDQEGGTPIISPGPRRYIQFSIDFLNDDIDATKFVEQLSIEYLRPPIADDLIAEIYPREVEASESVNFTYAVRALMNIEGVKGFDTFEVLTPTRVLGIDRIEITEGPDTFAEQVLNADVILDQRGIPMVRTEEGQVQELPYSTVSAAGDTFAIQAITDRNFIVRFPRIEPAEGGGERLLKIHFRGQVLLYSTLFRGQAILSSQSGSIQRITPGNAAFLGEGDLPTASGITVLSPGITEGSLVGSFALEPNPFTPNGDGINDQLGLSYDIVAVTRAAKVQVQVFDLSGRLVRTLYEGADLSGRYDQTTRPGLSWDGRDQGGAMVPPGIYLIYIEVKGDSKANQQAVAVAVAY